MLFVHRIPLEAVSEGEEDEAQSATPPSFLSHAQQLLTRKQTDSSTESSPGPGQSPGPQVAYSLDRDLLFANMSGHKAKSTARRTTTALTAAKDRAALRGADTTHGSAGIAIVRSAPIPMPPPTDMSYYSPSNSEFVCRSAPVTGGELAGSRRAGARTREKSREKRKGSSTRKSSKDPIARIRGSSASARNRSAHMGLEYGTFAASKDKGRAVSDAAEGEEISTPRQHIRDRVSILDILYNASSNPEAGGYDTT